ncbi:hypothetical protein CISIN_1g0023462mg, partial [Citrus sinensis]
KHWMILCQMTGLIWLHGSVGS